MKMFQLPGVRRPLLAAIVVSLAAGLAAQTLSRRATTLVAIKTFPAFFNGQPVLVLAELQQDGERWTLVAGDDRLAAFVKPGVSDSGLLEVRGEVGDLGRMSRDDVRLTGRDLRPLLGNEPDSNWPKPGDTVIATVTPPDAD